MNLVMRATQRREVNLDTVSANIILASIAGLLLAPLLYALRTLQRMRAKIIYPLLRIKGENGDVMTIVQARSEAPPANSEQVKRLLINPARQAGLANKEV